MKINIEAFILELNIGSMLETLFCEVLTISHKWSLFRDYTSTHESLGSLQVQIMKTGRRYSHSDTQFMITPFIKRAQGSQSFLSWYLFPSFFFLNCTILLTSQS